MQDLINRGILIVNDGYRAKRSELDSSKGLPFARAGNIDGGFQFQDAELLGWSAVKRAGDKVSQPGDVVFTSKGTVGRFALVRDDTPQFAYSPQLCFWRPADPQVLDSRYLYYWMNSSAFLHQVAAVKGQTDMADYVSLRDQRRMRLPIPAPTEQRRIAAVLGALDDKIELNRRMNRTLEEMAQAIFRSWFVDFDGQTEFEDSGTELGKVPKGWEIEPIGQVIAALGGSTPSTKVEEYWDEGMIHWTTPKDLSSLSSPVLLDTERKITEAGLSKISSGLLPVDTVLMSSRAPVGYLAIAKVPVAVNQGYIAIPPSERLSSLYVLHWLQTNMDRIKARAGGTTFQEISKRNFRPILALVPSREEVAHFDTVAGPLFERIVCNEVQYRTLADLRDTLLPKLISGEIRVPEAEEHIQERG